MFLEIILIESDITSYFTKSLFDIISQTNLIYFLVIFSVLYVFYILSIFIFPHIKKNPRELYKKYIFVRGQMESIDSRFTKKIISFEQYVSMQFSYAKEFEKIITDLAKFPEYKNKIENYKLPQINATEQEFTFSNSYKNNLETEREKKINFLYNLLFSKAKYYFYDELKIAMLDEGFKEDVILEVLDKIKSNGVVFASENKSNKGKITSFINNLFVKKKNIDVDQEIINTNNNKRQERIDNAKKVRSDDFDPFSVKNKDLINIKDMIKIAKKNELPIVNVLLDENDKSISNKKKPTINEINNIFTDIEKSLKEKK